MNKFVFVFLLTMMSAAVVLAADQVDLSEHGQDLMKAPFEVRYRFYNQYQKEWINSSYEERRQFLSSWHRQINNQIEQNKEMAKEEYRQAREKEKAKLGEMKSQKAKLKARKQKEKEESKLLEERNKHFDKRVVKQERTLERLQNSDR